MNEYKFYIPLGVFNQDYLIEDNYIFQWYKIPSTEWQPGLPPAIKIPVSTPEIKEVTPRQLDIEFTFLEEYMAWPHSCYFLQELFKCTGRPIAPALMPDEEFNSFVEDLFKTQQERSYKKGWVWYALERKHRELPCLDFKRLRGLGERLEYKKGWAYMKCRELGVIHGN